MSPLLILSFWVFLGTLYYSGGLGEKVLSQLIKRDKISATVWLVMIIFLPYWTVVLTSAVIMIFILVTINKIKLWRKL